MRKELSLQGTEPAVHRAQDAIKLASSPETSQL